MIKNIKWSNHEVLGNLEIDFSKTDGSSYSTIVLAGENGAGKTTILETLATFLNLGSISPFEYINYVIDDVQYCISPISTADPNFGFHVRKNETDGTTQMIITNRNNNMAGIDADSADIRHYGCAYSKARSGFNTQKVKSSTTQQLDSEKYEGDTKDDFTSIKQLIVDIDMQDNADWMRITETGINTSFNNFKQSSRKYRFEKAFNAFFSTIKFKHVDNSNLDEKQIIFEKHGKDIAVDNLSTGEKQIVFRGTHLLKNINGMSGGVILIDEPELSMHPIWQQRILQYYRGLFDKNGIQDAQMIIATHSEYVLRSALEDSDNVLIILLSDDHGTITAKTITSPTVLPTITAAETNYLAFGIISSDYHIQLYGHLQDKTGKLSIKDCDEYIVEQTTLYDSTLHTKISSHNTTTYQTLSTYIRNLISHPDPTRSYTHEDLKTSTELLIKLCRSLAL